MRRTRTNYAIGFIIASGVMTMLSAASPEAGLLAILIGVAVQIYLAAGRLKDMNANPWWSILVILPLVGFILMFPAGTKGENQYGEDPRTSKKE